MDYDLIVVKTLERVYKNYYYIIRGDILYSVVGSFGIPVYIDNECEFVFQRHIAILRPNKEKILPEFLYYTMLSRDFYMRADAVALGAAQRTVSLTSLRAMEIELPPIRIQENIVKALKPYDQLIENNKKQIKLLEEVAQRIYKEWFVNLHIPGYKNVKIVNGVPEGWRKVGLEEQQYGLQFVVSYYLEEHDKKLQVYIPRHFTIEKRVKLIEDYLKSDYINPNFMKLILNAKHTKELPITPKMKKMADKRNNEFWENNKSAVFHDYGFGVTFGPFENVKNVQIENSKWILEYDTGWIKDNTDYPTLLNNFIYLFEYIDSQARFTCVSSHGERHPLTEIFEVRGVGMYKKNVAFDMLESLSDIQMRGYVEQLIKLDINIEDIIKWFFETYLLQEFDIKDYTCNMPNSADCYIFK